MTENELPCRDCITLPICMIKYKETQNVTYDGNSSLSDFYAASNCERHCSLLHDYLHNRSNFNVVMSRTINFFNNIIQPKPKKITNGTM